MEEESIYYIIHKSNYYVPAVATALAALSGAAEFRSTPPAQLRTRGRPWRCLCPVQSVSTAFSTACEQMGTRIGSIRGLVLPCSPGQFRPHFSPLGVQSFHTKVEHRLQSAAGSQQQACTRGPSLQHHLLSSRECTGTVCSTETSEMATQMTGRLAIMASVALALVLCVVRGGWSGAGRPGPARGLALQ